MTHVPKPNDRPCRCKPHNITTLEDLFKLGSAALKKAALNEEAKAYLLANPVLFALFKKAARRYIAGDTLHEVAPIAASLNQQNFRCSLEFMGESTRSEQEAKEATGEFLCICQAISERKLNATVSLDLSHIGLALSNDLCYANLSALCQAAAAANTEVIISAEGTERTDAVLAMYQKISKTHSNVGVTVQAYLHRTPDDLKQLLTLPGRIRMVKGAFETPPGLSLPRGKQLDEVYLSYVEQLLATSHRCSIATHDASIQQAVKQQIVKHQPAAGSYEFESLYGIQTVQLTALKDEGYPTKMYLVYGSEWYLYVCNRIAEHPINIFQALSDIVAE
jgi:proline dehydrogenase